MVLIDPNIHALVWTPNNTSSDVDNNLADVCQCYSFPSFMAMIIASKTGNAGALCSINRPVPIINGLPLRYHRAAWAVRPSQLAKLWSRVYENDAILIWPPAPTSAAIPGQWYDGSQQANQSTTPPCHQIDYIVSTDPTTGKIKYGWQNTSVTDTAAYKPDAWNPAVIDYSFDYVKKTTSVIAINGEAINSSLQNVPANLNNWSLPVAGQGVQPLIKYQAQTHTNVIGGFETYYTLTGYWSDNPNFQ